MSAPVAVGYIVAGCALMWWLKSRQNADVRRIKRRHHE